MSWLSPISAIAGIVGGEDMIPNVDNPFNSTTDGTYGTTGSWDAPVTEVQGANTSAGEVYYDSQSGQMVGNNLPTGPSAQELQRQAQMNAARNSLMQGGQNVRSSADEQLGLASRNQSSSILDFFGDVSKTQQGLDQRRANAEYSRNQGRQDIMGMVGRGIRSGNVMLGNKGASSSSAKGQIARAYGDIGNREARNIENQYGLEGQDIDMQQQNLGTDINTYARKLEEFKVNTADSIASDVRNQLAVLNQQAQNADLGTLFQIEQEKQAIKDAAMAKFAELDTLLSTERAKIQPAGRQQSQAKANEMAQLGQGAQMFNFNSTAPATLQGGTNPQSGLPLYSFVQQRRRGE